MADLFEEFNTSAENLYRNLPARRERMESGENDTEEKFRNAPARAELQRQEEETRTAQEFKERFGLNYSIDQMAGLAMLWDSKIIEEDQVYDILTAQAISDNLRRQRVDADPMMVLNNLDAFYKAVTDEERDKYKSPKTNLSAVMNSFASGWYSTQRALLGNQRMTAELDADNRNLEDIMSRMDVLDRQMERTSDWQKRNPVITALEFVGQSAVYTAFVTAGGLIGGLGPLGSFVVGMTLATGQTYNGLREIGVEPKLASLLALGNGAVNALIESQLGVAAGLVSKVTGAKTLGAGLIKKIANLVSDKLHLSGVALKFATGPLGRYLMEGLFEGIEEGAQEIADISTAELAKALQEEGVEIPEEDRDYLGRIGKSIAAGWMSAVVMGLPGLAIDVGTTAAQMKKTKALSEVIPGKEAFKEAVREAGIAGFTDEDLDKIHEHSQSRVAREQTRLDEELRKTAGLGEGYAEPETNPDTGEEIPLGAAYKDKNGAYYGELDDERGIYKTGDRRVETDTNLWADIQYHKSGGAVVVDAFHARPDLDTPQFRRDVWNQFSEKFPGQELSWEPSTQKEFDIREDLVRNNPRGKDAGLNYYAAEDGADIDAARYRSRVISTIARFFPHSGNAEHGVMAALWENRAEQEGLSLKKYINREYGGINKAFTTTMNKDIFAAAKEGRKIKGAVTFENDARDARALIYVSRNADLSTFLHETGHVYRRRLEGEQLAEAERIWGVVDGKWTKEQEEQFTEDMERYFRDGKAPSAEKESFFKKMARFLRDIVNAVSRRGPLSPEVKQFFDSYFSGEQDAQTAEAAGTSARTVDGSLVEDRASFDKNNNKNDPKPRNEHIEYLERKLAAIPETASAKEKYNIQASAARELQARAMDALPDLRKIVVDIVTNINQKYGDGTVRFIERKATDVNPKPVKNVEGIVRKLNNGDEISEILDVMGMTIVTRDMQMLNETAQMMRDSDETIRIKDRYKNPGPDGYRDILANVRLPNGLVGEVQINTEQMIAAKGKLGGHKLYEITRVLDLSSEQGINDKKILEAVSRNFYGRAYELLLANAMANASSLDIADDLNQISSIAKREGLRDLSAETSKNLPPSSSATGQSSASKNLSLGSSKSGTSTAEAAAAGASNTSISDTSLPSASSIGQTGKIVKGQTDVSGVSSIREKYLAADKDYGDGDTINIDGQEIEGRWVLSDAGAFTASHNEETFADTEGFPRVNGKNINTRDYTNTQANREAVKKIAMSYDSRALETVVGSEDGIIISGNNRVMSGKLAAKYGTDGKYVEALKRKAKRYGFSAEQIEKYEHPRLIFEIAIDGAYDAPLFDKFNQSTKKAQSPLETAVKMTKVITDKTAGRIAALIGEHESLKDLYDDSETARDIFNILTTDGVIGEYDRPLYISEKGVITGAGEDFLETVLLGSVLDEENIRSLEKTKELRKKLAGALPALVENKAMGNYNVLPEVNDAVRIASEVQKNKKTWKSVEEYARQRNLDIIPQNDEVSLELARLLDEGAEGDFGVFIAGLNSVLSAAARGEADMFADGLETKESILARYLGIKARIDEIRNRNRKTLEDNNAALLQKMEAAVDNAGMAGREAAGVLLQTADDGADGSPDHAAFDDVKTEINRTFLQLESDLLSEAAAYDSWEAFRDAYEKERTGTADAWYRSFWNDARVVFPPNQTFFSEEEEARTQTRAQGLDKRYVEETSMEKLSAILSALNDVFNSRETEPAEGEDRTEYDRARRLQGRINRELPRRAIWVGNAAQVAGGDALSDKKYAYLKALMRKSPRVYRALFADLMNETEYLEDLAETKDGQPAARLADPRGEKENITEVLRRLAGELRETGNEALARRVETGEITMQDSLIDAAAKELEEGLARSSEALAVLENEIGEDWTRFTGQIKKKMLELYDDMLAKREAYQDREDSVSRNLDEGIAIGHRYQVPIEKSNYDRAMRAFQDYTAIWGIEADVREALARRDARTEERTRQRGMRRGLRALKTARNIKKRLVERMTRNVSFKTVFYDEAVVVKTIQRMIEPSLIEGVNRWIGGAEGPILREIWSRWTTDDDFKAKLRKKTGRSADKISDILNKDYDFITASEKKYLIKRLSKWNWVSELGLERLARENEESVQLDIEEKQVDGRTQIIVSDDLLRQVRDAIGDELLARIQNKPMEEWSVPEAEELAAAMNTLIVNGKRELSVRQERRRILQRAWQEAVKKTIKTGGIEINDDDTPEEKKRKQKLLDKVVPKYASGKKKNNLFNNFFDANVRRFTTALDGSRKGIMTNLLYWRENDAYNARERAIALREDRIEEIRKKNHITLEELYTEVSIPGLDLTGLDMLRVNEGRNLTVDDLLYIMRGAENEYTREALLYGNLSSAEERHHFEFMGVEEAILDFRTRAGQRLNVILDFAETFFAKEENKKFLVFAEAIGRDYDQNGQRLNRMTIDVFNQPMRQEWWYVPMNRRDQTGVENENRVIEDILSAEGAGSRWVDKGNTLSRIKISPFHQAPIEVGLYKTWASSVQSSEHLIAYAPLIRDLNAVFKGKDSASVRQTVADYWGRAAVDYITDTIAEYVKPNPTRQRSGLDEFIRTVRGKTATAYLAWKTSGIVKQLITSPFPYMQEINPLDYIAAAIEVAGGFGKINKTVLEKSIYLRKRDFDPMVEIIREQMQKTRSPLGHAVDRVNTLGMKGLEWADRVSVIPGWLAVYKRQFARLTAENEANYRKLLDKYHGPEFSDMLATEESKVNRALSETLGPDEIEYEAVALADDAVRRMQPSSRSTDRARMFKNRNEITSAVLQFQEALNVIWQNLRYDLPLAIKEHHIGTLIGMITGYALAGIAVNLVTQRPDEDDDEAAGAARILYYALTQFSDSVPVLGDAVTNTFEGLLTGKVSFRGEQNIAPVAKKGFDALANVGGFFREESGEEKMERLAKAGTQMTEAFAIFFGLPVSGTKEALRAIGIGDKDGELGFNPEAFLGRR